MNFFMPTQLISGHGAVLSCEERIASFGKKCLLVTSGTAATRSGALKDVTEILNRNGIAYQIYDRILPNPTVASCIDAGQIGTSFGAEFVIGIGGGSPLDAAKVVAVSIANPSATEATLYAQRWVNPPVPVILVGTTAGTGSEVTPTAVLTNSERRKASITGPALFAALSIGDPRYTETMSLKGSASTGMDALCHCVESFLSKTATPVSRGAAVEGIRMLVPQLERIAQGIIPSPEEREILYDGSILGGLAICVTGTLAPHSFGYFLTEQYDIPHGFACAFFLPALLEHVSSVDPALCAALEERTGIFIGRLLALTDSILPDCRLELQDEQIAALLPRWDPSNKYLHKSPGCFDAAVTERFLRSVFHPI